MATTVKIPGSSATVPVQAATGGDVADASWYEEYVADFTDAPIGALANDATVEVNGIDWKSETDTNESLPAEGEMEIIADGLEITSYATDDNIHAGITAPVFSVLLSDVFADLSNRDEIAIQVLVSEQAARTAIYRGYGMVIYTPAVTPSAVGEFLYRKNWYMSSTNLKWSSVGDVGGSATSGGENDDDGAGIADARDIVMEILFSFNGNHAITGNALGSSGSLTPYEDFAKNRQWSRTNEKVSMLGTYGAPAWDLVASTARLGIAVFTANASGDEYMCRFTKARFLRLGGSGGGAG
jgi:hypothetical protein